MKNFNIILYFAIINILISCASNFEEERNNILNKHEKKDLVSSFDISKADSKNFSESDPNQPVVEVVKKVVPETKVGNKKSKKKVTPVETKEEVKIIPPSVGIVYPAGYPEEFKKYDLNSKQVYEKFKPIFYKGEQSLMAISYLGVTAGYITMLSKGITKMGDRLAYDFYARFKSKEAYKYFYWLDDYLESYVDKETFIPIKYSLVQREKKQNVDDLQLFDSKKLKNYTWYKRVKEGSNRDEKKEVPIPYYLQDSFSALQFVRGLPLKKGDLYDIPVATRAETWILKLEVIGEEVISVNDADVRAIRVKAETHFPGVLQKSGDILFWYSADEVRRLLKFQAKVKLGSIFGELIEYKPGVLEK